MQILRIQHARVPKIRMLNHKFREDSNHLIVTLDVEGFHPPATSDFLTIYHALAGLFPTLARHSCCEDWENTPLFIQSVDGVSIKTVGEVADIAHLVEHVMVDLQCAISGMRLCSGITCGHREPENRFDLFIECIDPRVGAFTAQLATYLVATLFHKRRLSRRYRDIVGAARLIVDEPALATDPVMLSHRLDRCPMVGRWLCAALTSFGLINGPYGEVAHEPVD
jgi:hypothetical protein